MPHLRHGVILGFPTALIHNPRTLSLRSRVQEVEQLKGLRYAHSLALEAMDVAAPLLQRLLGRLGDAVSWLLVRLIGRSLGLIYRGVRESLIRPRPRNRNAPGRDKPDAYPSPQLDAGQSIKCH